MLKAVEAANRAAEKKATDKETIAALRGEIATLKEKVSSLETSLAVNVEKAKMEATANMHGLLLKRYQDGLRDGASLSSGGGMFHSPASSGPAGSPN